MTKFQKTIILLIAIIYIVITIIVTYDISKTKVQIEKGILRKSFINKLEINNKNEMEIIVNTDGKVFRYIVAESNVPLKENMKILYEITEDGRVKIVREIKGLIKLY